MALPTPARANDGGISYGGSPRLLTGHPTVSMKSEVVRMRVGEDVVHVDCRFVFHNNGPACSVRMGFPDQGEGADDPDEEHALDWQRLPPKSTFSSFASYVDGKAVETKLIRAASPGHYWHAKTVRFPANADVAVRDVYTVNVGGQITALNSNVHQTFYILHTGASWHGPIGRTEVDVTFDRKRMTPPLKPIRVTSAERRKLYEKPWPKGTGVVYYQGPSAPTVEGGTLRFVRTSWRPAAKDDILLFFDNLVFPRQ